MKEKIRPISDDELDALLSGSPVIPRESFVDRTIIQVPPVQDAELDRLLSGQFVPKNSDFTERTLARVETCKTAMVFDIPAMRWLAKSGMVAAIFLIGIFSFTVWQNQNTTIASQQVEEPNMAEMNLEELLYLQETLKSAKVLIELEKTVPLYYLMKEADS